MYNKSLKNLYYNFILTIKVVIRNIFNAEKRFHKFWPRFDQGFWGTGKQEKAIVQIKLS